MQSDKQRIAGYITVFKGKLQIIEERPATSKKGKWIEESL